MVVLVIVELHYPLPSLWIPVKFDSSVSSTQFLILHLHWKRLLIVKWRETQLNSCFLILFGFDIRTFCYYKLLQASNSFGWHDSLWFSYSWPIQASSAFLASQHFWGCTICNRQNRAPSSRRQFTPYLIEQNMNLICACKFTLGICNG
jgi:hypothetical protein